jgi:hypothetical protein
MTNADWMGIYAKSVKDFNMDMEMVMRENLTSNEFMSEN